MRLYRLQKLAFVWVAAALLPFHPLLSVTALADGSWGEQVQLMAHRGNSDGACPENTVSAFRKAIESDVHWIEIDVTQTKDGVPVVLHDDDLSRTTGHQGKIWELTYEEVKNLTADAKKGPAFKEARIPSLEETLDFCRDKVRLDIEIKWNGHQTEDFVERIVELVRQRGMLEQCMITSFWYDVLTKVKALEPGLATGYITAKVVEQPQLYTAADSFMISIDLASPELVSQLHSMGKKVTVWTVNDPSAVDKCREAGADGLITDRPDYIREAL